MIRAAQQPFKCLTATAKAKKEGRALTSQEMLDCIMRSIQTCYPYFTEEDKCWWELFFENQQNVLQVLEKQDLENPFSWPLRREVPPPAVEQQDQDGERITHEANGESRYLNITLQN